MTDETFLILASAVNIAKDERVQKLDDLRRILKERLPGQDAQIEEAISAWAQMLKESESG